MNKILVIGDIHGRKFWEKPCENIEKYQRVIFLGDYFDPYNFENIGFDDCIQNFQKIIELKKNNTNKVVLLLGNHDEPYVSDIYYHFSIWHCRHSSTYHDAIHKLFNDNIDFFKIAHVEKDILFTHAGVDSRWLERIVKCNETEINKICDVLNNLQNNRHGLEKLHCISRERGGRDICGSCIWADVHDMLWDVDHVMDEYHKDDRKPIHDIKQVFGHTIQAYYDKEGNIVFGNAIEFENIKMVDTTKPYELNIDDFKIKVAE
jgi:predicted phosphodiesterase